MNRTYLLLIILVLTIATPAFPQTTRPADEKAIEEVIHKLFLGMQQGDSAMVHSVFTKELSLATVIRDKNSIPVVRWENSIQEFLVAVGTPHQETWYEEIWNMKINIDDAFAQAWCDYAFYLDNDFSHCGVDAFHLVKTKDVWKIFHLADTRRKEGCIIPKKIKAKHQ